MELRQLRYFLTAVTRGSLKEAARTHFVTQPAISLQLKKLEEEVGEKLYGRHGHRIVPTEAGRVLARHAEEVLRRVDALSHALEALRGCERGTLKLGNIDAASTYVLPAVFRRYRKRYPGIDIRVVVTDTGGLLSALDANDIEIAIVTLPVDRDDLRVEPFYKDELVLVVSPRHELALKRSTRGGGLKAVAESGLITYPADSTTRRIIEKTFLDSGLRLRAAMEMSSPEAIKRLTEAGLGASILPWKLVSEEVRRGTLKTISTGKVRFFRILGVVYKDIETLSPPAAAFLAMLKGEGDR